MAKKSRFQPELRGSLWYVRDLKLNKLLEYPGETKSICMGSIRCLRIAERTLEENSVKNK